MSRTASLLVILFAAAGISGDVLADTTYRYSGTSCHPYQDGHDGVDYYVTYLANNSSTNANSYVCPVSGWQSASVDVNGISLRFYDESSTDSVRGRYYLVTSTGTSYSTPWRYSCGAAGGAGGCISASGNEGFTGIGTLEWIDPFGLVSNVQLQQFLITLPKSGGAHSRLYGYTSTFSNP